MAFIPVRPPGLGDYLGRPGPLRTCLHIWVCFEVEIIRSPHHQPTGACPHSQFCLPTCSVPQVGKSTETGKTRGCGLPTLAPPQGGPQPPREEGQPGSSHTRVPHTELGNSQSCAVSNTDMLLTAWRGCPTSVSPVGCFNCPKIHTT